MAWIMLTDKYGQKATVNTENIFAIVKAGEIYENKENKSCFINSVGDAFISVKETFDEVIDIIKEATRSEEE